MTEQYYCPLSGDKPINAPFRSPSVRRHSILIPGKRLPIGTTDEQAEHERAMIHAVEWSREKDGSVIVWVDM